MELYVRRIFLDLVCFRVRLCGRRFVSSDLQLSSLVMVASLRDFYYAILPAAAEVSGTFFIRANGTHLHVEDTLAQPRMEEGDEVDI